MKTLRTLALAALAAVALGLLGACGSGSGSGSAAGNDGSAGGDDSAAACQKLISNTEIAGITGVADLTYDPTGSVVDLPNARICPYQDAKGYEAIVTVYTGPAYGDAFQLTYTTARQSPNPVNVPGLGKGAVWIETAYQLDVDLGQTGLEVEFLFKNGADEYADRMAKAIHIATVVSGHL